MEQKKVGTVVYPEWIERAKKMLINKKSDKRYKEFCVLLCEMILNEGKIPEGWECDNLVKTYLDTANIEGVMSAKISKYKKLSQSYQRGKSLQNTDNQEPSRGKYRDIKDIENKGLFSQGDKTVYKDLDEDA